MTTTATATDLYAQYAEFRSMIDLWVAHRRCPLPLVDWLLELGMESMAEAARWAATEPERPVSWFGHRMRQPDNSAPFPLPSASIWYWYRQKRTLKFAHDVPEKNVSRVLRAPVFITPTDTILWLLTNWRI